jgi:hypothetical protein
MFCMIKANHFDILLEWQHPVAIAPGSVCSAQKVECWHPVATAPGSVMLGAKG